MQKASRNETSAHNDVRARRSAAQAIPAAQHGAGLRVPATAGDL